ncbi:STAS domain-containing protein [Bacillus thermotolerans]|uniref:STAS domain-containing protein n=1 Tax=Bacillus thermotolerans TaxID=1221996 RepID=UPI00057F95DE|nr:STAS domain-containing protein [Bacillus thermotolerans]KKB36564.1 RsbR, positive regulator of sigma-B [Bacillus thermotolerans]
MKLNKQIYDFFQERLEQLTEDWYNSLDKSDPEGIYATDDPEMIANLKDQNFRFHKNLTQLLILEEEAFYEQFEDWITEISSDKEHLNTPIHFIIREFTRTREQYMDLIDEFSRQNDEVNQLRIDRWKDKIVRVIDRVVLQFTEETYKYQRKLLEAQKEMINELSSPVIKLKGGTALLPLVGDIDTARAKFILENTLQQCADLHISHLLIDVSGVVMIDTMVAYQLFQLIDALELIGVKSTLSGIRPEIAQTAVQLGLNFEKVHTVSTLAKAINF